LPRSLQVSAMSREFEVIKRAYFCSSSRERGGIIRMSALSDDLDPCETYAAFRIVFAIGDPIFQELTARAFLANYAVPSEFRIINDVPVEYICATDSWWLEVRAARDAGEMPTNPPKCELLNWLNRRFTIGQFA